MLGGSGGLRRMAADIDPVAKKLQDELLEIGQRIKHHEDNVKYLTALTNKTEDSIVNIEDALEKYDKSSFSKTLNSDVKNEEESIEHIKKSAAALLCMMKNQAKILSSEHSLSKDVIGIVATLGKINDDSLNRLFSEYLGVETMLAVVCKTYDGVKALEAYDKDGLIDNTLGLHAFAANIGRPLAGRFLVICLEDLRPYAGEYMTDDPQKRLALQNPRLPNGETPPGFIGFAVNMITLDRTNLHCISKNGHGLRKTLFYNLFLNLQVYRSREDMLKALSCVTTGAISLDGGIIRRPGLFSLGHHQGDVSVKFANGCEISNIPERYFEINNEMKETQWKKNRAVSDMQREHILLDHARSNYETKKREFLHFLAESSSHVFQSQVGCGSIGT